ncbi:trehalose-phosphatase [soil metagenome]
MSQDEPMLIQNIEAAIFDLDGVITSTASVHSMAWKKMFDEYLSKKEEDFTPFNIETDYLKYVDGKPRYEGVKSFLSSRSIELDYGDSEDTPDTESICGLGNKKNSIFQQLLSEKGFEIFEDAVKQIKNWRKKGIKTAIVSSSKNCKKVLDLAMLNDLFDIRIDGLISEELKLQGKPNPDIFFEAAKMLQVSPSKTVIFEDAIAGVEAGKNGKFKYVVGVQKKATNEKLIEHGADVIINNFDELDLIKQIKPSRLEFSKLSSALDHHEEIKKNLGPRRLVLFLDYDGTLTPIVKDPSEARLSIEVRKLLEKLSQHCTLAVVSGRDLSDVRKKIKIPDIYYAGSHGMDIIGPELHKVIGEKALPQLKKAEEEIIKVVEETQGAKLERKKLIVAAHYRNVSEKDSERLRKSVQEIASRHEGLKIIENKKVIEIRPDVDWHKGMAIDYILNELDYEKGEVLPVFLGDDITDEDGFEYLHQEGVGIVVGDHGKKTSAKYKLNDTEEVKKFLLQLYDIITLEPVYKWNIVYENYIPEDEPLREALCTLGNGYFATRGAAEDSKAEGVHYPGTYLAGGYNRAESEIAGRLVENEDLVNWPNWLSLTFRIDQGEWFQIDEVEILDYQQVLNLRIGLLERKVRFRNKLQQETEIFSRRIVSQRNPHLAAIQWRLEPKNWSGTVDVCSMLDGRVLNNGVERYKDLNNRHISLEGTGKEGETGIYLISKTLQSKIFMAQAARTELFLEGRTAPAERETIEEEGYIAHIIKFNAKKLKPVTIEKIVSVFTSKDVAIADPELEARKAISHAGNFEDLYSVHCQAWKELWRRYDISIEESEKNQMILRLHIFHLLQTVSMNSVDLDIGVPARGWHGEAYRGHIFWDEFFIFPFINLRVPELSRSLLMYRYRRLEEARKAARQFNYKGAMFPWQSGSNGREETQEVHLNPESGQWLDDNTFLQRHISADIVFNIMQYFEATEDNEFMNFFGAEIILDVANFFSSKAEWSQEKQRYEICNIVGPDEYHTEYPKSSEKGINNNAYTNIMASWVLKTALEINTNLEEHRHEELLEKLNLKEEDLIRWEKVSREMYVPFIKEGIINQFEEYEKLKELNWNKYRQKYGNSFRLDRILQAEGDDVNAYKASKQADVLMLFYLFSTEELQEIFDHLNYKFEPKMIRDNINYYESRTSHGSTLSQLVHSWVLARSERKGSWNSFRKALLSDFNDVQGGTTAEGIHLGAMAGTVDLIQRCYAGITVRDDILWINPQLPENLKNIKLRIRYRGEWVNFSVSQKAVEVKIEKGSGKSITLGFQSKKFTMRPGDFQKITYNNNKNKQSL